MKSIKGIFILNTTLVFMLLLLTGLFWIKSYYKYFSSTKENLKTEYIENQKKLLLDEAEEKLSLIRLKKNQAEKVLKQKIKLRVEEAYGITENLYNKYKETKTKEELKEIIKEVLRPIKYNNGRGYYFISSLSGIEILFSDKPELEGKNLKNLKSADNKFIIKDMIKIAKEIGEGYTNYMWTKPNSEGDKHIKISYLKYFEPYDWIIGTGEYLEDVTEDIKKGILRELELSTANRNIKFTINTLEGKELLGKKLSKIVIENLKKEGLKYIHIKQDKTYILTYGTLINELNWIFVVSTKIEEETQELKFNNKLLVKTIKNNIKTSFFVVFMIIILMVIVQIWISRKIEKNFTKLYIFFEKAVDKSLHLNPKKLNFLEFKVLATFINNMISKKTTLENEIIKAKEEAEHANKYKTVFLANMSHELRTPLNGVIGAVELINSTELTEEQEKYSKILTTSSENLLNIIDDVLDLSKIESGGLNLEEEEFFLKEIMDNLENSFKEAIEKKGISFVKEIEIKEFSKFKGDKGKIIKILSSIVENSLKFTKVGEIKIQIIQKEFVKEKDNVIEFLVSDTGIGISKKLIKEIQNPFVQGDSSYTKQYEGAGLGLSISKKILKFLGSELEIESIEALGTKVAFILYLKSV